MAELTSILPIALVVILVICVIALMWFFRFWERCERRKNARREGRYLPWEDVRSKLLSGAGTAVYHMYFDSVYWSPRPDADEDLLEESLEGCFLTDCPRRLRSAKRLRKKFPMVKVVEVFGRVITCEDVFDV